MPYQKKQSYSTWMNNLCSKERELRRLKAINQRYAWLRRNEYRIREYVKKSKALQEQILNQYLILLAEQGPSAIPNDVELQFSTLFREAEGIDLGENK